MENIHSLSSFGYSALDPFPNMIVQEIILQILDLYSHVFSNVIIRCIDLEGWTSHKALFDGTINSRSRNDVCATFSSGLKGEDLGQHCIPAGNCTFVKRIDCDENSRIRGSYR